MTLYRVTKMDDCSKKYAKNRAELKSILHCSVSTLTRIIRACLEGRLSTAKGFVIKEVEVDDASIKEVS